MADNTTFEMKFDGTIVGFGNGNFQVFKMGTLPYLEAVLSYMEQEQKKLQHEENEGENYD